MAVVSKMYTRFGHSTGGAVAIEYGILAMMICVALLGLASMGGLSRMQSDIYNTIAATMAAATENVQ